MDLLDSRRQSKDQEIIDNIDKNFEGKLQVKIKSRHFFFFPPSSSRFCMPLFFYCSTSCVAYFAQQFRRQVYHIYQFCCHFSNHIFISLAAAAACLLSNTFHLPLATTSTCHLALSWPFLSLSLSLRCIATLCCNFSLHLASTLV